MKKSIGSSILCGVFILLWAVFAIAAPAPKVTPLKVDNFAEIGQGGFRSEEHTSELQSQR